MEFMGKSKEERESNKAKKPQALNAGLKTLPECIRHY